MAVRLGLAGAVGEEVGSASWVELGVVVCRVDVGVGDISSSVAEAVLKTVIVGDELEVATETGSKILD